MPRDEQAQCQQQVCRLNLETGSSSKLLEALLFDLSCLHLVVHTKKMEDSISSILLLSLVQEWRWKMIKRRRTTTTTTPKRMRLKEEEWEWKKMLVKDEHREAEQAEEEEREKRGENNQANESVNQAHCLLHLPTEQAHWWWSHLLALCLGV